MSFRKSYRADSYERAAKMACEDIEYWGKENQCLFKRIAEVKGKVRKSYFGGYIFFIIRRECFEFIISGESYVIIKLPFDQSNQINDKQIVDKLRRSGLKIIINEYLSYNNVIEKGVLKDSINNFDVQNILTKYTINQLINILYDRGYGKLNEFIWS